jgi:hypothetical protein
MTTTTTITTTTTTTEATTTSQQVLAITEAVKAREQIVKDVMSEIPKEDRGKLMNLVVNCTLDNKVSFVDCLVLFSLMVRRDDEPKPWDYEFTRSGLSGFDYSCSDIDFKLDDDGRIIKLDWDSVFEDSTTGIERLERLTMLNCLNCNEELSNLPHLQILGYSGYDDSDSFQVDYFPVDMKLDKLRRLQLNYCEFKSSSSLFLTWMSKQISNLEHLSFDDMEEKPTDIVLDALRDNKFSFQNKLKSLTMNKCSIDGNRFAILLLEILPGFKKVSSLDLGDNKIESVQLTVDRITKNDHPKTIPKSLRIVDLNDNPMMKNIKKESKENTSFMSFLHSFNTIINLGGLKKSDYGPDLEYALRINHAGGRTVIAEDGSSISNHDGSTMPALSFPVWPILLERSYARSGHIYNQGSSIRDEKDATGLYDLVRNSGLALLTRPKQSTGNSDESPTSSLASSASSNGDDDIGKKQSSKRKCVKVSEITNGIVDDDEEKNNTAVATYS